MSTRQFSSLYLVKFASSLGFITVLTLLPKYINLLQPTGVVVGVFVSALSIARVSAIIPLSWAGDRYDKRTLLLFALGVSILAYLLFGIIDSSLGFVTARLLQGLGIVGTGLLGLALISELAPVGKRAAVIGTYNRWRMAAGILGTLGAGALYQVAGFGAVFTALAILLSLSMIAVTVYVNPDETSIEGFALTRLALNRRLLTITSFRAPYAVSVTLVRNWIPIYVGVSVARGGLAASAILIGLVVAAEKFTNMVLQPRMGRLSDRYGRTMFIAIGGGLYGVVALIIPAAPMMGSLVMPSWTVPFEFTMAPTVIVVLGLNGLLGVADSIREPASMATFADEGVGEGVASSFGLRNLVWMPGSILAPIVGGILMDSIGMAWVFYLGGAAAIVGVVVFMGILMYTHGSRAFGQW